MTSTYRTTTVMHSTIESVMNLADSTARFRAYSPAGEATSDSD